MWEPAVPHILLVEDDSDVRMAFEQILLEAGHEVDISPTYQGASDLLRHGDYKVLIADGRLPDGSGIQLADEARRKGIPALIVTGNASVLLDESGLDFTKYRLLLKPVRPQQLIEAVAMALRLSDGGQ
jgi:DNA-binding response OmpR family regulator